MTIFALIIIGVLYVMGNCFENKNIIQIKRKHLIFLFIFCYLIDVFLIIL